jgi:hypothetical protein
MNRLDLRNNRLKFRTSGKQPIFFEESIQYISNRRKNRKMSTCNWLDLETLGFLCPEISPDTGIMEVLHWRSWREGIIIVRLCARAYVPLLHPTLKLEPLNYRFVADSSELQWPWSDWFGVDFEADSGVNSISKHVTSGLHTVSGLSCWMMAWRGTLIFNKCPLRRSCLGVNSQDNSRNKQWMPWVREAATDWMRSLR